MVPILERKFDAKAGATSGYLQKNPDAILTFYFFAWELDSTQKPTWTAKYTQTADFSA